MTSRYCSNKNVDRSRLMSGWNLQDIKAGLARGSDPIIVLMYYNGTQVKEGYDIMTFPGALSDVYIFKFNQITLFGGFIVMSPL